MERISSGRMAFPETGKDPETLLQELEHMQQEDIDWKRGRTWSLVYYIDEPHLDLLKKAHHLYFSENALNPFAFQSVQRLEREIVKMTVDLLHGGETAVGSLTSGGTESISLAVYSYRERARRISPAIRQPEMVVPASIHPAFFKAGHLMGINVKAVPLGKDLRADPAAMEAAITANTIMLAASAPCYPYGIVDPIEEIAAIAKRKSLPCHVDACVGGFMLPWVETLGYPLPVWDFRVAGVTSVSADLHKFAYGSKGASLLLFKDMEYMRHQFYILSDWCGGVYASPSMLGTRSVGPIAAAWAALKSLGRSGYLEVARNVMDATTRLRAGLEAISEIEVLGEPSMNLLAFTTRQNRPDLFVVADQLAAKGWMVDRQQRPNSIHVGVMSHNIAVIDQYLDDVREAVAYGLAHPEATASGEAALYGLMARLPFRGMIEDNVRQLFENRYSPSDEPAPPLGKMPRWQGWLNRLWSAWERR